MKQQKEITSPELKALDALLNITVAEDEETHPQDGTLNLNQFRYDRICGITNLLLNCIFIKKYLGEKHLAGLVDSIEWDHLYSNFSRFDPRNGTLQDVTPALKLLEAEAWCAGRVSGISFGEHGRYGAGWLLSGTADRANDRN